MNNTNQQHTRSQSVLGIDIGRVIIGAADASGRADTSFITGSEEAAMRTPASDGAFETIADLVASFDGRVWLVSKCGPRIQQLTLKWLAAHRFYERTGIDRDHVRFCLKRPEKREHCAAIGATHFIDDRLDVLEHLHGLVPHLYWFGRQVADPSGPPWVVQVPTWDDVRRALLADIGVQRT